MIMHGRSTMHPSSITRRTAFGGLSAGGLGFALGARLHDAAAQGVTTAGHPLVGTWFLESTPENPSTALNTFSLHADGTYVEANADGTVRLGVWEATGPTTATLTIETYRRDAEGASLGGILIRLAITLNPDGNSYTAEGTIELIAPDGSLSGQAGPATGTAKRMRVEAPSAPVMSLDQLFGGAAGTPEATPAP
jgi:hypothetical protein